MLLLHRIAAELRRVAQSVALPGGVTGRGRSISRRSFISLATPYPLTNLYWFTYR